MSRRPHRPKRTLLLAALIVGAGGYALTDSNSIGSSTSGQGAGVATVTSSTVPGGQVVYRVTTDPFNVP